MKDVKTILIEKLTEEYLHFKEKILLEEKVYIFDRARKIDIYNDVYGYLSSTEFSESVAKYLIGISPLLDITYLNWISFQSDYDYLEDFLNDKILNMDKRLIINNPFKSKLVV